MTPEQDLGSVFDSCSACLDSPLKITNHQIRVHVNVDRMVHTPSRSSSEGGSYSTMGGISVLKKVVPVDWEGVTDLG